MATTNEAANPRPSRAIQFWSFALPVIKCAICPACLSIFGGLFAGARMGFLGDERFHGGLVGAALIADFFFLRVAMRHHRSRWPLWLCIAGGALALGGHVTAEWVELTGFGFLILAAVLNVVLLRRHHREVGSCCPHDETTHAGRPLHEHT